MELVLNRQELLSALSLLRGFGRKYHAPDTCGRQRPAKTVYALAVAPGKKRGAAVYLRAQTGALLGELALKPVSLSKPAALEVNAANLELALTDSEAETVTILAARTGTKDERVTLSVGQDSFGLSRPEDSTYGGCDDAKPPLTVGELADAAAPEQDKAKTYASELRRDWPEVRCDAAGLRKGIHRVLFAAAASSGRYAMCGVSIEPAYAHLALVATDGVRVAIDKVPTSSALTTTALKDIRECTFPVGLIHEVQRLSKCITTVALSVRYVVPPLPKDAAGCAPHNTSCGYAVVRLDDSITLTEPLVDGFFPKYRMVVPKDQSRQVVFQREKLLAAIKKVSAWCGAYDKKYAQVRLSLTKARCIVTAEKVEDYHPRKITAATSTIPAECEHHVTFVLKARALMEMLERLDAELITLKFGALLTHQLDKETEHPYPVVFTADEYKYVLMPITALDEGLLATASGTGKGETGNT